MNHTYCACQLSMLTTCTAYLLDPVGRPTDKWITQWLSHIGEFSDSVKVPTEAAVITTPVLLQNWASLLSTSIW